jgi:hypothetical protein
VKQIVILVVAGLAWIDIGTGTARADDAKSVYKLVVKDKALYGAPVDDKHFRTCGGIVIEQPNGARMEPVKGPCPDGTGPLFRPYSGHGKLKPRKGTPAPRAS